MAIRSVVLMVFIGATGIYVKSSLEKALESINTQSIPGMRSLQEVKIHQQAMAIAIYQHMLGSKPEQKLKLEKAIDDAKQAFDKSMTAYEAVTQSAKEKELAKAERAAFAEYIGLLPPLLEKSRANDIPGALNAAAPMTASRLIFNSLIEEHLSVNAKNTDDLTAQSKTAAQRGV